MTDIQHKLKYIFLSCLFVLGVFVTLFNSKLDVYAITLDNDGSEKENPYGDTGIPKSFSNAEYYDCYIPYNVTCKEIGGYATGAIWSAYEQYNAPMSESMQNSHVGTFINYENDLLGSNSTLSSAFSGMNAYKEESTGMQIVEDANGTQYYISAFPGFLFYNDTAGSNGFSSYSSSAWGTAVDLILTDGTVIHFAMGDSVAPQHSNGGIENPQYFDVIYDNAPLNMPQYIHLFQAQSGHTVEVWGRSGCSQAFMDKYNIGDGEGKNKVAVARVYNTKVSANPSRSSGVGKEVSYSLGDVTIGSGEDGTGTNSMGETIKSEWELVGMEHLKSQIADQQNNINLMSRDDLSTGEAYSVATVGENIVLLKEANVIDTARIAVVFIGLCLVFYAVMLLVAYLFDYSNSFLEISLVKVLTFGYLEYSDDELAKNERGKASSKRLLFLVVFLIIIGCLFISGGVLRTVMELMMNIYDKIGG